MGFGNGPHNHSLCGIFKHENYICTFSYARRFVLFSQQTDSDLMDFGLKDIRTASCRVLREPKPFECKDYNGAGTIAATFGLVTASAVFLTAFKMF